MEHFLAATYLSPYQGSDGNILSFGLLVHINFDWDHMDIHFAEVRSNSPQVEVNSQAFVKPLYRF